MLAYLRARGAVGWRTASAAFAALVCFVALAVSAAPSPRPPLAVAHPPLAVAHPPLAVAHPPLAVAHPLQHDSTGQVVLDPVTIRPSAHPLDGLSAPELGRLARQRLERLGPAIVGRSNRGTLLNPVRLESVPGLEVMNELRNYATPVAASSIRAAAAEVRRRFPGSVLRVGDLSARRGGYIRPHRSHQSGVDADIGFYYRTPERWYTKATAKNFDRARNWTFLKALVAEGTVEYVFVDRSVQALLREHALETGESPEFVESLFSTPAKRGALVRHTWGHLTHFHVRFIDPQAEETGRRLGMTLRDARRL